MAEIRTVAVIGAGISGRGIACAAALGNYRTILEDILPASLRKAEAEMRASLEEAVRAGQIKPESADAAMSGMEYASTVEEAARQADLVIEAAPDELESKLEIFVLLDKISKPETILASNTSSLSITDIASMTYRPEKCIGMRFVNPVHTMRVLELVRGRQTDDATVAACVEVGRRMGKQVVLVSDTR